MPSRAVEEARARGERLLRSHLSPDQVQDLVKNGWFDVEVDGRVYRLNRGRIGNVTLLEGGEPVARFCIHPEIEVPDSDTLLAQKLLLESDERSFLKTANRTKVLSRRALVSIRERVTPDLTLTPEARESLISRCLRSHEGREKLSAALYASIKYGTPRRESVSESLDVGGTLATSALRNRLEVAQRLVLASHPYESRPIRALRKWAALAQPRVREVAICPAA